MCCLRSCKPLGLSPKRFEKTQNTLAVSACLSTPQIKTLKRTLPDQQNHTSRSASFTGQLSEIVSTFDSTACKHLRIQPQPCIPSSLHRVKTTKMFVFSTTARLVVKFRPPQSGQENSSDTVVSFHVIESVDQPLDERLIVIAVVPAGVRMMAFHQRNLAGTQTTKINGTTEPSRPVNS